MNEIISRIVRLSESIGSYPEQAEVEERDRLVERLKLELRRRGER